MTAIIIQREHDTVEFCNAPDGYVCIFTGNEDDREAVAVRIEDLRLAVETLGK